MRKILPKEKLEVIYAYVQKKMDDWKSGLACLMVPSDSNGSDMFFKDMQDRLLHIEARGVQNRTVGRCLCCLLKTQRVLASSPHSSNMPGGFRK